MWNVSTIDNEFTQRVASSGEDAATGENSRPDGGKKNGGGASLVTLLVGECVWTETRRGPGPGAAAAAPATETEAMRDCRLQLWGALWALSGSAASLQTDSWIPLFKHAISILDASGRRRSDTASVEVTRRSAEAMSPVLRGGLKVNAIEDAAALQPPFVLAQQRHLVTAVVGMLGHTLDYPAVRDHLRDLNGSDDVLSRLLTAADPEVDDKIIALTRMALSKLVEQELP